MKLNAYNVKSFNLEPDNKSKNEKIQNYFVDMTIFWLLVFMFLSFLLPLHAETKSIVMALPSDQEISIDIYGDVDAQYKVLWIPSERGVTEPLEETLTRITKEQSISVHLPDFHDSYFITPSSSSLEKIPQTDVEDLIKLFSENKSKNEKGSAPDITKFIITHSRSVGIVLNATHHLQTQKSNKIAGIILISPYIQNQTPEIGKLATYQKIASHSNLPLFIFQPERSPRFVPLPRVVQELEKGGSAVFVQVLKGIQGGFHMRPKADLGELDMEGLKKFPSQIFNALSLLEKAEPAELKTLTSYQKNIRKKSPNRLQKVDLPTPQLTLSDMDGKVKKLSYFKGKVVIASFWASWCKPCLDEMPSLVKLKQQYQDQLEILAVNIGEDKKTIQRFTKDMNINFPILIDKESRSVKDWKVYVYPSNFILDKSGSVKFAATGAMDWQEESITKIIQGLSDN